MTPAPAFIFTDETEPRACPACERLLTAATGVSLDPADRQPRLAIGNITCCAYCGTILTVTTIGFRFATDAELADLDPALRRLVFEFAAQHRSGRA